jgi:hypothetical protein
MSDFTGVGKRTVSSHPAAGAEPSTTTTERSEDRRGGGRRHLAKLLAKDELR